LYIKDLKLNNFRNYKELYSEFNMDYNIICGKNAQGKTNILEAIFLCSSGRSHRTSKDNELIKFLENSYYVNVDVNRKYTDTTIEIYYEKDSRKKIKINSVPSKKNGELMGQLNTVIFSPEDMNIIKGSPSERRRYIDIAISQLKPSYFYNLQQYSKIIAQRNCLLKTLNINNGIKSKMYETLDIWNEKLVETGSRIMIERYNFLKELNEKIKEKHIKLTGGREELEIRYAPSILIENGLDKKSIENSFYKKLVSSVEREIKNCATLYGPQRDDMEVLVNEKNVKLFGSQGQQRTVVLSLKPSEVDIAYRLINEYPVLLLDDVFSELDIKRQQYLIESIKGMQVFITTTEINFIKTLKENNNLSLYMVEEGVVKDTNII